MKKTKYKLNVKSERKNKNLPTPLKVLTKGKLKIILMIKK